MSHTGPKTSRAARDRPEPKPRRNQTSRHDIAGNSPERRPATAAPPPSDAKGARGRDERGAIAPHRAPLMHTAVTKTRNKLRASLGQQAIRRRPVASGGSIRSASVRNSLRNIIGHRAPSITAPHRTKAPSIGRDLQQRRNIIARMLQHTSRRSCEPHAAAAGRGPWFKTSFSILKFKTLDTIRHNRMIRSEKPGSDTTCGDPDPPPGEAAEEHRNIAGRRSIREINNTNIVIRRAFKTNTLLALVPGSNRNYKNPALLGRYRQSGPRPEPRLLRQAALEALTNSARTDSPRRVGRKRISGDDGRRRRTAGGGGGGLFVREGGGGF
ncbi:hypothetical protein F511_44494 [Dorcoceras hygrometricum]|uniref:Uncharacterized protein n=1 Tax=Dorcoceras hygrometricum TaxID=472368 RepID=A0A2Z7CE75_9LAMI|nr:hypothetical protein F511_44494 [Dorcoceras hygrometricum]